MSLSNLLEQLGITIDEDDVRTTKRTKRNMKDAVKDSSVLEELSMGRNDLHRWEAIGQSVAEQLLKNCGNMTHEWLLGNAGRFSKRLQDSITCQQHGVFNRQAIIDAALCRELHAIFNGLSKLMRDNSQDIVAAVIEGGWEGKCQKERLGIIIDWSGKDDGGNRLNHSGQAGISVYGGLARGLGIVKEERNREKPQEECGGKKECCG